MVKNETILSAPNRTALLVVAVKDDRITLFSLKFNRLLPISHRFYVSLPLNLLDFTSVVFYPFPDTFCFFKYRKLGFIMQTTVLSR